MQLLEFLSEVRHFFTIEIVVSPLLTRRSMTLDGHAQMNGDISSHTKTMAVSHTKTSFSMIAYILR